MGFFTGCVCSDTQEIVQLFLSPSAPSLVWVKGHDVDDEALL